ncbi:MAG: hypothetical protein ABL961_18575, partial [Vicinamibacterales bacterium]
PLSGPALLGPLGDHGGGMLTHLVGLASPAAQAPPVMAASTATRVTTAAPATPVAGAAPATVALDFVCEDDVRRAIRDGRTLIVAERAIITPAARDLGEQHRVFATPPSRG